MRRVLARMRGVVCCLEGHDGLVREKESAVDRMVRVWEGNI